MGKQKSDMHWDGIASSNGVIVLELRMAGVGDLLFQVSRFFWFCECLGVQPLIHLPEGESRNVCALSELFELFGFYQAGCIAQSVPRVEPLAFSVALNALANCERIIGEYFKFDNASYGHPEFDRLSASFEGRPHPALLELFRRSSLYARVMRLRSDENRTRVVVHVRRGDVAQVELSSILPLLADGVDRSQVAHVSGVYSREMLKQTIAPGNYWRFKPIEKYKDVLVRELKRMGDDVSVCLLSDGYGQLAAALLYNHRHLLRDGLAQDQLEHQLNADLQPLILMSQVRLVGESSDALINSILYGLSAEIIVSASPGFFRQLVELMQLDVEIVIVH